MASRGSAIPDRQSIVADVVEGEAVIINVATGIYYSADGIGGWIWEALMAGASLDRIEAALRAAPGAGEADVAGDLDRFIALLAEERLVTLDEAAGDSAVAPPAIDYAAPALNIYRDMTDLMALDPPMPMLDPPVR